MFNHRRRSGSGGNRRTAPMAEYKCDCCGEIIDAGAFTRTQLAVVDALQAACGAFRAAGETRIKSVLEATHATVDRLLTVLTEMELGAPVEQQVAIRKAVEHAAASLTRVGPS